MARTTRSSLATGRRRVLLAGGIGAGLVVVGGGAAYLVAPGAVQRRLDSPQPFVPTAPRAGSGWSGCGRRRAAGRSTCSRRFRRSTVTRTDWDAQILAAFRFLADHLA